MDESETSCSWMASRQWTTAASLASANGRIIAGGTVDMTWPNLFTPQICRSRSAVRGASFAMSRSRWSKRSWWAAGFRMALVIKSTHM
jgi:hypothetical protein